jgi:integrase
LCDEGRVFNGCGYLSDISASRVQTYLAERRRGGLSIRTSNFYLQAIKQFLSWMVADGRTPENLLSYVQGQNPKTDIRHERRALTLKELNSLLPSTLKCKKHHNLTGEQRYMLYTLALTTGFRCRELASLTWRSLNLSDSKPSITVLAGYAKNKREVTLPLRKDVADLFKQWFAEGHFDQSDRIFSKFNESRGADMLRKDLEVVGIPYQDDAGRFADFHSLRHSFASILNQSGVSPKVAQSLLRHSTIGLTMDTYTHIGLYDERAAVDSLPALPGLDSDSNNENKGAVLKTGTDDLHVTNDKSVYKPVYKEFAKRACSDSNQMSSFSITEGIKNKENNKLLCNDKCLSMRDLSTKRNQLSSHDNSTEQEGFEPPLPFGKTVLLSSLNITSPFNKI